MLSYKSVELTEPKRSSISETIYRMARTVNFELNWIIMQSRVDEKLWYYYISTNFKIFVVVFFKKEKANQSKSNFELYLVRNNFRIMTSWLENNSFLVTWKINSKIIR